MIGTDEVGRVPGRASRGRRPLPGRHARNDSKTLSQAHETPCAPTSEGPTRSASPPRPPSKSTAPTSTGVVGGHEGGGEVPRGCRRPGPDRPGGRQLETPGLAYEQHHGEGDKRSRRSAAASSPRCPATSTWPVDHSHRRKVRVCGAQRVRRKKHYEAIASGPSPYH